MEAGGERRGGEEAEEGVAGSLRFEGGPSCAPNSDWCPPPPVDSIPLEDLARELPTCELEPGEREGGREGEGGRERGRGREGGKEGEGGREGGRGNGEEREEGREGGKGGREEIHIAATDQRPDLVVWNNKMKEVWVVELTICFENRFDEANLLKAGRYVDLMQQVTTSNYSGTLY